MATLCLPELLLVLSTLDCCNALLAGHPNHKISKLGGGGTKT